MNILSLWRRTPGLCLFAVMVCQVNAQRADFSNTELFEHYDFQNRVPKPTILVKGLVHLLPFHDASHEEGQGPRGFVGKALLSFDCDIQIELLEVGPRKENVISLVNEHHLLNRLILNPM